MYKVFMQRNIGHPSDELELFEKEMTRTNIIANGTEIDGF